ncbi:MAG TPA: hypothetical protein VGF32_02695 [Streptosporangiaceae bacterium]
MHPIRRTKRLRGTVAMLAMLSLPVGLLTATSGAAAAAGMSRVAAGQASAAGTLSRGQSSPTSLGEFSPTFTGPAATGCAAAGCSLLTGPFRTPSTKSVASGHRAAGRLPARDAKHHAMPLPMLPRASAARGARQAASDAAPTVPTVSCQPLGPGCDTVSTSAGGALGVRGVNAVDSGTLPTNPQGDIEPSDGGMCAGNGDVVQADNIGEIMVYNAGLHRLSGAIPLDTLMGLTGRGWSSGGDPSCEFDPSHGGHWFFTEIASASTEASGGPFSGCFAGVANACFEAIAVTVGSSPFGPYNVYFLNANYNQAEPGAPSLLNDFAKIGVSRDAFLMMYDEFPLDANNPGLGGGGFNGAQEFAFDKDAMEHGEPVTKSDGSPNLGFNVAIENMGLLPTPDGTCFSDNQNHRPGVTCWIQVIPAQPPDASQFDNSHNGSAFMVATLDFHEQGDNRLAVFDWTGLHGLDSHSCATCGRIQFGGQLFSDVLSYNNGSGRAAQKAGPIPLGDECGAAGLSTGTPPPASCPEGPIATNGDGVTQASQAQGQLWASSETGITQTFSSEAAPEAHQGAVYWVVGTDSFDRHGVFSLSSQSYVSAQHEDLEMSAMAAEGFRNQDGGNGGAIILFTLNGNGGPTAADNGGFFPSTAYGRLTSSSDGLRGSVINVADLGQSPQDGFGEYQGFPGRTRPRWGDYNDGVFMPGTGKIYFATGYIQFPNCTGADFTLTLATCGGTRDGNANWGTSVNSVVP